MKPRRFEKVFSLVFLLLVVLGAGRVASAAEPNQLTEDELKEGWIQLFDGQTLFGWKPANKADWKVADGAIVVTQGDVGLLNTTTQFGDYVLKADFRSAKGTNSGIFLRTSTVSEDVTKDAYELNIADTGTNPFPTGSLVKRKKIEGLHDSADWQTFEVNANGGHFIVKLDGKQVLDYTDEKPLGRGFIGLQLNQGKVEFRDIKIKPLNLKSLLDGKSLSGWKVYPGKSFQATLTPEGVLSIKGGRGQLESETKFADFTVQMEVKSNRKHSNSGLFFRSIPGQMTNGYECQLHNTFGPDGPSKKMIDCGTGGICRRQNARKIVAKDLEWYCLTLIADGSHMAVWVNGYQVSDWTDRRKENENPRRGKRLEAGTLILQGHDATTDYHFRNIRAAKLPKR